MAVALILIDALSPVYVSRETLPELYNLADNGFIGPLANIYAYRGIEATLFTGQWPDEHGVWGEFSPTLPRREHLGSQLANLVIGVGDCIPSDRLRLDVRYVVSRLSQPGRMLPTGNLIPVSLMPRFKASIEQPIWEKDSLGTTITLFDELRAGGRAFVAIVNPAVQNDDQIVDRARDVIARGSLPDFWYIKFSALDALGHRFGPDVSRMAPALAILNDQLVALCGELKRAYGKQGIDIIVVSDHGMSQVRDRIDIRALMKGLRASPGRDYLYFLDSTTVRFWSPDRRLCDDFAQLFAGKDTLRVVTPDTRQMFHIPNGDQSGDVMLALEEGTVVFPDFFRRQVMPVGMHGYAVVRSEAGLPFLAVEQTVAHSLPSRDPLTHVSVWAAMRERLGFPSVNTSRGLDAHPGAHAA